MDEPADVGSQDRSGWHLVDGCVSTRNRRVEGSNSSWGNSSQLRAYQLRSRMLAVAATAMPG